MGRAKHVKERKEKMSVWKSVKNNTMEKAVDMEMLERGLEAMGVSLDYTVNSISNSWGHEECTAAFVKDGLFPPEQSAYKVN